MLFALAGAGPAILFIVSMAAWAVLTAYLIMIASRVYLVVFQGTAAGIDKVEWPDEPIYDWILTSCYFLVLTSIILLPAGLLTRALADTLLPNNRPLRFLLLAGPFWWFFFPLALLSSLSSGSRWVVFSPQIVGKLFGKAPLVLGFYFFTAGLCAVVGPLTYAALFSEVWYALPLAVAALSAVWMIHARLLGRLAWGITYVPAKKQRSPAKRQTQDGVKPSGKKRPTRSRIPDAVDPWAVPEEEVEPLATSAEPLGYEVKEEVVEKKPPRANYLDPEPDPYAVAEISDEEVEATIRVEANRAAEYAPENERVKREVVMRTRGAPNPPPTSPLFSGVYEFPLYPNCRPALIMLMIFAAITSGLFRFMLSVFPN